MGIYTIILRISGWLQKLVNMTILLKLPSAIGGGIIGLVEGYFLAFIIILIIMIPLNSLPLFQESKVAEYILNKTPIISQSTSSITKSVTEIYTLTEEVANKKIDTNAANLKSIDIMLKYKVTTPHTIEQLIVLDKLKNIEGLEYILDRYK